MLIAEINSLFSTITLTVSVSPSLPSLHFKVDAADHYTSGGSFNVELNAGTHQVQLVDTVVKESDDVEYRFSHWSGITSGSGNPTQIEITASSVLEADFNKYYKIVFTESGGEGTLQVTVDGTPYPLPQTLWFESGSQHSFNYEPASGGAGIRCAPASTSYASPITVGGPTTVTANYKTQYYVTVTSEHGDHTPSQWVDKGGNLVTTVISPADNNGAGMQYRCTGYKINDENLQPGTSYTFENIQAPQTIDFQWTPQYSLVASSTHELPSPMGTTWYDSGTSILATVPSVADDNGAGTRYRCNGWTGTGSVPPAGTDTSTAFIITSPSSITWNWIPQYQTTFGVSGLEIDRSVTITVNGNPHSGTAPFSFSEWYDKDFSVTLSITSLIDGETPGKRYAFTNWKNSAGTPADSSVTLK